MREKEVRYDLGHYGSMAEVWKALPGGGRPGQCLWIGSVLWTWDSAQQNWRSDIYPDVDTYRAMHLSGDLDLDHDLSVGGKTNLMQDVSVKRTLTVEGTLVYSHLKGMDCGLWTNITALRAGIPKPDLGQWALVGTSGDDLSIYNCQVTGTWQLLSSGISWPTIFNLTAYNGAKAIVDDIAARGYIFMGVASPGTVPVRPTDYNVFYLTNGTGRYDYFGGIVVNTLSVLTWNHATDTDDNGESHGAWSATALLHGVFVTTENIADGAVTPEKAPEIVAMIEDLENKGYILARASSGEVTITE